MTTPFPSSDDEQQGMEQPGKGKTPARFSDAPVAQETIRGHLDETPKVGQPYSVDALSDELSDEEKAEAIAALAFLNDVREESRSASQPPTRIGRYSILRTLGRGGFSEVFLAEDEELDRRVALKIPLIHSVANDPMRLRFQREAKLAAMLAHPQIVPVYEFGSVGRIDFIAYGWVEGDTLAHWLALRKGNVDGQLAAKIVAELSRAMHFAHERGVIHRDLKPSNVLLDQSEANQDQPIELRTRITDLGLSRDLSNDDQQLTQTGQAIGTPAYMSPEQAAGSSEINVGTDVYGLGIMLFEMLTGKLPFRKANSIETIKAIHEEPAPAIRKFNPTISKELAAIVDKCLQKKPSQRYVSAFELAEDLDAFAQGRPVSARPVGMVRRATRWVARNQVITITSLLVLLSLSIGLGAALWQRNNANLERARAEKHLANMTAAVDLLLADINTKNEPTSVTNAQRELLAEVLKLQQSLVGNRDYEKISKSHILALHRSSQIFRALGNRDEAVASFNELRTIELLDSDIVDRDLAELVFESYLEGIRSLELIDQGSEALNAVAELERFVEAVNPLFSDEENIAKKVSIENLRGRAFFSTNQLLEALKAHQNGQVYGQQLIEMGVESNYRDRISTNLINLSTCQTNTGDREGALDSSGMAISLLVEELGDKPKLNNQTRNLAVAHLNRSGLLVSLNRKGEAVADARLAIDLLESLTDRVPENNGYLVSLAAAYSKLAGSIVDATEASKLDAIKILDDVLAFRERGLEKTLKGRMWVALAMSSKSSRLVEIGELESAMEVSREASNYTAKYFADDSGKFGMDQRYRSLTQLLNTLNKLGRSEEFVSRFPEFIKLVDALIVRDKKVRSPVGLQRMRAWVLRSAAKHFSIIGEFDKALAAVDDLTQSPWQTAEPKIDWARTTSEVLSNWQKVEGYPTTESKAALNRAFRWMKEAIVETGWTKREYFERESMQPIVKDERFAEVLELLEEE